MIQIKSNQCSMEAREDKMSHGDTKGVKRHMSMVVYGASQRFKRVEWNNFKSAHVMWNSLNSGVKSQ